MPDFLKYVSYCNKMKIMLELIYMAALLHDIAKWKQYMEKMDHAVEGAVLAKEILEDIGVGEADAEKILDAIRSHRTEGVKNSTLSEVIYLSDKSCRLCVTCKVLGECNRFTSGQKPVINY